MAAGLGFKDFTTGEVLTAADVDGYLMQGIWVFASNAARDAAVTAPAEGNFAFTKDTNSLWYYDGAAWVASGATGDIEGVTAGVGISGGGTSGTVTITNSMATAIDAKGDLVAGTGADTFARLAVGANGTVLTADSTETTGLKWVAAAGGGKVLQVVMGTGSTSTSVTSTSYVDSGLSATITPSSASNKILALIAQYCFISDNTDLAGIAYQLVRDSTAVYVVDRAGTFGAGIYAQGVPSVQLGILLNGNYLDTPATTSAITYKMQAKVPSGDTAIFQQLSQISTLILLEIGA